MARGVERPRRRLPHAPLNTAPRAHDATGARCLASGPTSEQVIIEIGATLEGAGGTGSGKLRVTDQRLVFERKTLLGRQGDVSSVPPNTIQSASISGVLEKKLKVRAGSTELVFKPSLMSNDSQALKSINDVLHRAMAGTPLRSPSQPVPPPAPAPAPAPAETSTAWIAELRELGELRAAGAPCSRRLRPAPRAPRPAVRRRASSMRMTPFSRGGRVPSW